MPRLDPRLVPAAVLCAAAAAARLSVGEHITDDAYITMRYSRNLSAAGALSYNPPDAVLGTSTPLWTAILAAGNVVGLRPESTALGVSTAADFTSIVLILTTPAAGTFAAIAASATIAAWPGYVMYAVSGMETSLYVLTIVAFVTSLGRGRAGSAAVAAGLATLCRPDGALLIALGATWTWVAVSPGAALRFGAVAFVLCAPWAVYALLQFGSVIPASVTAKAAAGEPWFASLRSLRAYFFEGPYVLLTPLAIAGLKNLRVFRLWALWGVAYLAAMTAANAFTHFPWYFVPLLPIYTASAASAAEAALSRLGRTPMLESATRRAAVSVLLAAALLSRMPSLKTHLDDAAAGRERLYASVAVGLAAVDARCTVAATEIGTIGYHYPGRVLDLVGLVSPEAVGRPMETVLAESRARWLVTYDTHFDRHVAAGERFSALFERRSAVRVGNARTLEVYERRDPTACGTP
jgi:hypothetical protein